MMEKVSQTDRARFQEITGNADGFLTINQLCDLCDREGYWTAEFMDSAAEGAKKSHIRRIIKTLKDDEEWPVWASVETTDTDGKTVHVYKQECLFDVKDYQMVAKYHADRSAYHVRMAKGYAKRCKKRFNTQLHLNLN